MHKDLKKQRAESLKRMDEHEECEICGGDGEVSCDEMVDGNIERGVGTQKCECKIDDHD